MTRDWHINVPSLTVYAQRVSNSVIGVQDCAGRCSSGPITRTEGPTKGTEGPQGQTVSFQNAYFALQYPTEKTVECSCGNTMNGYRSSGDETCSKYTKLDHDHNVQYKLGGQDHETIYPAVYLTNSSSTNEYLSSTSASSSFVCQEKCERDDACKFFTFYATFLWCETYTTCSRSNAQNAGDPRALTYTIR